VPSVGNTRTFQAGPDADAAASISLTRQLVVKSTQHRHAGCAAPRSTDLSFSASELETVHRARRLPFRHAKVASPQQLNPDANPRGILR